MIVKHMLDIGHRQRIAVNGHHMRNLSASSWLLDLADTVFGIKDNQSETSANLPPCLYLEVAVKITILFSK